MSGLLDSVRRGFVIPPFSPTEPTTTLVRWRTGTCGGSPDSTGCRSCDCSGGSGRRGT